MTKAIIAAAAILLAITVTAQEVPKGYTKGKLVLSDGTELNGYIKESLRSKSSLFFMQDGQSAKKTYTGAALQTAEINGNSYRCIKGDFFQVLVKGNIDFLKKAGDASSQPSYRAGETVFIYGTDGEPGDYFLYDNRSNQLTLVNKKNTTEVAGNSFKGCTAAIDKAKLAAGEPGNMKEAVEMYNNCN